jgi:hypothetical protein
MEIMNGRKRSVVDVRADAKSRRRKTGGGKKRLLGNPAAIA